MRRRTRAVNRLLRLALVGLLLAAAGCTAPVQVEWITEVEMDTAGFDLYRGPSPEGPFDVKVNEALIPASPDPLAGGEYSFTDRTTQAGQTYYYQLQEVEINGQVNTYGPIAVRAGWLSGRWAAALAGLLVLLTLLWLFTWRRRRPTGQ